MSETMHPENFVNTISQERRKFHPILVTGVFVFVDVLIRFWDSEVKVTAGNDPKNRMNSISL